MVSSKSINGSAIKSYLEMRENGAHQLTAEYVPDAVLNISYPEFH